MRNIFRTTVLILVIMLSGAIWGQMDSTLWKYAKEIREADLQEHLMELADDRYEGRETGMAGQKLAATYIEDYFKSIGIAPLADGGYQQSFPLQSVSSLGSTVTINGSGYEFIEDFYFFSGFKEMDLNLAQEEFVWAGYGIEDEKYSDYKNVDVKGKLVIIMSGEPFKDGKSLVTGGDKFSAWTKDWRKKRDLADQKGAKAVLIMSNNYDESISRIKYWLENPSMRLIMPDEQGEEVLPTLFISKRLGQVILKAGKMKSPEKWLKKLRKKGSVKSKAFQISDGKLDMHRTTEDYSGSNVLAYIPGSDLKDELVVVTAHYDHVGIIKGEIHNGADDDGSGTVSALEIAQAFKKAKDEGNGPRRSVLIMTVSGEEKGLLGSRWYSENPVFPLETTVCDLNIDMIGRVDAEHADDSNYIYLIGSDKLSTTLHKVSEEMNSTYTNLALDYTYNDPEDPNRYYYRSDHYNFARKGVPVIFYFSGVHEDYHQPTDTPDKILYGKMETVARLVFATAWKVANQDGGLPVDVENDFSE